MRICDGPHQGGYDQSWAGPPLRVACVVSGHARGPRRVRVGARRRSLLPLLLAVPSRSPAERRRLLWTTWQGRMLALSHGIYIVSCRLHLVLELR